MIARWALFCAGGFLIAWAGLGIYWNATDWHDPWLLIAPAAFMFAAAGAAISVTMARDW